MCWRMHLIYSNVSLSTDRVRTMTSSPIVTMISSAKPNQPNTMAALPTPLLTEPFPRSCAIVLAATDAVCCHSTETNTKMDATKMIDRASCETKRDGNGRTSRSSPSSSISRCQLGNVARRMRQTKAKIMAMMLVGLSVQSLENFTRGRGLG